MDCVFFACQTCKISIGAGYRWEYWSLEHPGIVHLGRSFSAESILSAAGYWAVPGGGWPTLDHLVLVRQFLLDHAAYPLIYGNADTFEPDEYDEAVLDWMELGPKAEPSVRAFAAQREYATWNDVVARHQNSRLMPFWSTDPRLRALAQQRFEQIRSSSQSTGSA